MALDFISFLAGAGAGVLTGVLAGLLHNLENTAELHQEIAKIRREVETMDRRLKESDSGYESEKLGLDALYRDLEEINEKIKRMYKRTAK